MVHRGVCNCFVCVLWSTILRGSPSFLGTTTMHAHHLVVSPAGTSLIMPLLMSASMWRRIRRRSDVARQRVCVLHVGVGHTGGGYGAGVCSSLIGVSTPLRTLFAQNVSTTISRLGSLGSVLFKRPLVVLTWAAGRGKIRGTSYRVL